MFHLISLREKISYTIIVVSGGLQFGNNLFFFMEIYVQLFTVQFAALFVAGLSLFCHWKFLLTSPRVALDNTLEEDMCIYSVWQYCSPL